MTSEERSCPECGGHISMAANMGWQDASGRVHAWVGTCLRCNMRIPNQDHTFGIDATGRLVRVDAVLFDE